MEKRKEDPFVFLRSGSSDRFPRNSEELIRQRGNLHFPTWGWWTWAKNGEEWIFHGNEMWNVCRAGFAITFLTIDTVPVIGNASRKDSWNLPWEGGSYRSPAVNCKSQRICLRYWCFLITAIYIAPEYESWQVINETDFDATGRFRYKAELHVRRYPELVPIEQTRECFASAGNKFPRNQIKSWTAGSMVYEGNIVGNCWSILKRRYRFLRALWSNKRED